MREQFFMVLSIIGLFTGIIAVLSSITLLLFTLGIGLFIFKVLPWQYLWTNIIVLFISSVFFFLLLGVVDKDNQKKWQ